MLKRPVITWRWMHVFVRDNENEVCGSKAQRRPVRSTVVGPSCRSAPVLPDAMKTNGSSGQQLVMRELTLVPGGEWEPLFPGWLLLHLTRGLGYWMQPRMTQELASGSVVVLSEQARGIVRSSQLGPAVCHFFFVEPRRLTGLITLPEQRRLEESLRPEAGCVRLLRPTDPIAAGFRRLNEQRSENQVLTRLQMLELFIRTFEAELNSRQTEPVCAPGAKARVEALLREMPPAELVDLGFDELVAKAGCGARHFGRVFHQLVGMSFREKQAEVRLGRAQELLAHTQSKVLEVAIESGYQSLSLFNLMFKKRFGTTPAKWRQRCHKRKPSK
jgi:AraC-like DNA-binding protein